jgi:ABC-2 type transport system ATP-binding protein
LRCRVVWRLVPREGAQPARVDALRVRGLRKSFSALAVDDLDLTTLRAAWPQRRRQDHHAAHDRRPVAAREHRHIGIDALADPVAAKPITARLPDEPMIYDKLTPLEYLEFVAGLWGVEQAGGAQRRPVA